MTLEQMARDRGVLLSDKVTPCAGNWSIPQHPSSFGRNAPLSGQCIVNILGVEINTASFAMYSFSLSVFVQAILIISMSGAADHGSYRKSLLVTFAFIGSVATMLFIGVVPELYILGGLLGVVANTCFGASFVLLNSFLPLLVRHHSLVLQTVDTDTSYTPLEIGRAHV